MRRRRGKFGLSREVLAVVGFVAIALGILLTPRSWTGWLTNFIQPVVPIQRAAATLTDSVRSTSQTRSETITREAFDAALREQQALENTTAALTLKMDELQIEVDALTATRQRTIAGRAIGTKGRLIPVRVLSQDLLTWRDSRLIDAGNTSGIQQGAEAISAYFTAETGSDPKIRNGLAILRAEILIGWVEQVGAYSARVRLVSDPATQIKVRIGRQNGTGFTLAERYFWLMGHGRGRMEIRDVERKDVESHWVQVGDLVMSDPLSELLPTAMVIGHIANITADRDNPLFAIISVESAAPLSELRKAYIFDPMEIASE